MSKKPHKVEEPKAAYAAPKPVKAKPVRAQPDIRYADLAKVRETNAKLIQTHRVVLEKLAR